MTTVPSSRRRQPQRGSQTPQRPIRRGPFFDDLVHEPQVMNEWVPSILSDPSVLMLNPDTHLSCRAALGITCRGKRLFRISRCCPILSMVCHFIMILKGSIERSRNNYGICRSRR